MYERQFQRTLHTCQGSPCSVADTWSVRCQHFPDDNQIRLGRLKLVRFYVVRTQEKKNKRLFRHLPEPVDEIDPIELRGDDGREPDEL